MHKSLEALCDFQSLFIWCAVTLVRTSQFGSVCVAVIVTAPYSSTATLCLCEMWTATTQLNTAVSVPLCFNSHK